MPAACTQYTTDRDRPRKQKVPVSEFLGSYMDKTAGAFFRDWGGIQFPKRLYPLMSGLPISNRMGGCYNVFGEKEF